MAALIEFLKKYNYWFIFILLEVASFVLFFRFNSYQGSVWFTQTNSLAAKVNKLYTDAEAFIHLDEVNSKLTAQNTMLQMQVSQLRDQLKDATHKPSINDRHILDSLSGYTIYSARVVSASIVKNENYIVIDKGSADGIKPEMGVVGGGGVVGIVRIVNSHYSLVLPIINRNSRISCRIRRTGYYGSLIWDGGSIFYANLVGVPQYARAKRGDAIETSGYSTVFPPGLFVGKVTDIKHAPDGLSQQLVVNLGTNFGNLRDVNVFENLHKQEIQSLIQINDSLSSKQ
ncbi:MAG: rod shape-determining protein MreC [Bacteroidaceae bacterium]|nr:rod shape-determining protein MreC [Bacteroidaceae bacterium]